MPLARSHESHVVFLMRRSGSESVLNVSERAEGVFRHHQRETVHEPLGHPCFLLCQPQGAFQRVSL